MFRYRVFAITLILCAAVAGCSIREQSWTISTSDRKERVDVQAKGIAKHSDHPRLSKETFNKLASQLEQLTVELSAKGENITTIVDEWGYIRVSGSTVSNARRKEIADHIFSKFEGARWVHVETPTPLIESVQKALRATGDEARDQGGNNYRFGYATLKPDQARQGQNEGAVILDVRSREEFEREHIKGAVNIPLNEVGEKLNSLPEGQLTIMYFSGPVKEEEVRPVLKKIVFERKGYFAVLDASIDEWAQAGHQTEGIDARRRIAGKLSLQFEESNGGWSESTNRRSVLLTDYPKHSDLVNAKGQIRR
jgi:rhodanese-related sulfurtransferase